MQSRLSQVTKQHFCIGNSILPHSLSFLIQHHFLTLHLMNSDFTVFSTSLLLPTLQQFYCSQVSDSPHSFCSVSYKFLCVYLRVSQLYSVPWISIHASIPLSVFAHALPAWLEDGRFPWFWQQPSAYSIHRQKNK